MDEAIHFLLFFGFDVAIGIKLVGRIAARNLAGHLTWHLGGIEIANASDTAFARDQPPPVGIDADTERRQHTHSGHNDTSHIRIQGSGFRD